MNHQLSKGKAKIEGRRREETHIFDRESPTQGKAKIEGRRREETSTENRQLKVKQR
jgi:hypothetical protein